MQDFIINDAQLTRIEMPEADVSYLPSMPLPASDTTLLKNRIEQVPWRQEKIVVWGKRRLQPRLAAWFGDEGCSYSYSGIQLTPLPWTDILLTLRRIVEEVAHASFNSVLLNYYRDHQDSMGFHSDDEVELGKKPVIAALSLGDARTFIMKHKRHNGVAPVRLRLASGSLLTMKGDTQRNWKHGIARENRPCRPRVSLTFRRIVD